MLSHLLIVHINYLGTQNIVYLRLGYLYFNPSIKYAIKVNNIKLFQFSTISSVA